MISEYENVRRQCPLKLYLFFYFGDSELLRIAPLSAGRSQCNSQTNPEKNTATFKQIK